MKRLLCLLLTLCCTLPLAACAGLNKPLETIDSTADLTTPAPEDTTLPDDQDVTTEPNDSDSESDSDVTTEPIDPPEIDPVTGDNVVDLEGYTYNAYVYVRSGSSAFYCEDFWVETASKDVLSYAVYARNHAIEKAYNCRIRQYDSEGDQCAEMTRFYFNNTKYELAILLGASAAVCSTMSLLQDVYSLENIKLEHAAYDQNAIQDFTMGGKLYFISGDMNIAPLDSAAITIFNPDLFAKYDFVELCGNEAYDDLYEMVEDGTWTVSAMLEMAEEVNVDADKNGILTASKGDTVGYLSYSATPMYYWYGCGARVSTTDPTSGYPTLTFGTESDKALFDFLFDSINNKKEGNQWIPNGGGGYRNGEFMADQLLFTDIILWDVRKVLHPQDKANYGILPTPKYNAAQERYYDLVYWPYGTTHLWSIPTKCENIDKASFMFHLMAQYSNASDGTMQAYFEKTLCKTTSPDNGSRKTIQTVRNSLTYDYFLLYNWGDFIQSLIEGIDTEDKNLYEETVTKKNLEKAVKEMNLTLDRFKNPITLQPPENTENNPT